MSRRHHVAPKHRASTEPVPAPGRTRPKHRTEGLVRRLGFATRRGAALAAVASVVTVGAVGSGIVGVASNAAAATEVAARIQAGSGVASPDSTMMAALSRRDDAERLSRSESRQDARVPVDGLKLDLLKHRARSGGQATKTEDLATGDPRSIAQAMLPDYGWSSDQFGCLDSLWTKESGWNKYADNPTSSAYGIPQALPGSKMASAGADWADNPATQIEWGLGYIQDVYGSPCSAWGHSESNGWY